MQLTKKSQVVVLLSAIAIAAIFLMTPWGANIFPLASSDYGTGLTINTKTTKTTYTSPSGPISIDNPVFKVENALNYNDLGEVFDSDRYIVSWQPGEYSKAITARVDVLFKTRYDRLWSLLYGLGEFPTTFIKNNYWWDVTFTDVNGVKTRIIDGKNFTGGTSDTSIKKDYVRLVQGYPKRPWPSAPITEESMPSKAAETNWWAPSNSASSTETVRLETETFVFEMKGARVGALSIKCYLLDAAYAYQDGGMFPLQYRTFKKTGPLLLAEDTAYLPSGIGEVKIDSLNSIKSVGTDTADGTGITYTKYVWAEGQNVTFNIKTGYSGTSLQPDQEGYKEGWYLKISNSKGEILKTGTINRYVGGVWQSESLSKFVAGQIPLSDGLSNYKIRYQIPKGAFIPNDPYDNEWMVTLSNTLFDQSETRIFVVDSLDKIPGQAHATFDKDHYKQWETCKLTLTATPNPSGTNDIHHFRVWVTYDGWTSTNYALTARSVDAIKSGSTYTAYVTFQVALGDKNLYATTVAVDSQGRAGPEGEDMAYVEQVIPNPWSPGDILGGDPMTLYILLAVIILITAGGIGLYYYQKKGTKIKLPKGWKK